MDIRSKHLSSEERGVILAEHNRGSSQRLIGQLLHRPGARSAVSWREVGRKTATIARKRRGRPMMPGARAAAANASLWRGAIFIVSFMASSYISTGHLSRLRRDCVS